MAVVTFSAAKQTTFTTPIEGTDAVGGLTITRASQNTTGSAVLTVNSLAVGASVADAYGLYVNAPAISASFTLTNAYGTYIAAPAGAGTRTNAYTLGLAAPSGAGTDNYSLLAAGAVKIATAIDTASTSFNLLNANATTVNFAGAATTLSIGASTGTTTVNNDLNIATGKTYKINGATVLSATSLGTGVTGSSLTSVGTIGTGVWNGTSVTTAYGGTGLTSAPATGTLLYGSGSTALNTLAAGSNGQILVLSGGVPTWGSVPATGVSGIVAVANGGTGTSTGSITGTGALTFTAGAGNNNVNLVPTGTGTVDVGNFRITNVAVPTQSGDAVNKLYVDTYRTGIDVKDSVHVATTSDITATIANAGNATSASIDGHTIYSAAFTGSISGTTLTVSSVTGTLEPEHTVLGSGVANATYIVQQLTGTTGAAGTYQVSVSQNVSSTAMTSGMRVLVKDQTGGVSNGIYVSQTTAWVRSWDMPAGVSASVNAGLFVFVEFGTVNANIGFVLQNTGDTTVDVGTSVLSFSQFSGAGQITVTAPLQKTGNTLSIDTTVVATTNNSLALTNKTYNGLTVTTSSGTLTIANAKTFTANNTLTLAGTDSSTLTFNGTFTTGSTFSTTGAFSTSAAFSTTGTGTLTIAAGSSNRTITLGGNVSTSADFSTTGTGSLTIAAGSASRTVTLGGDITTVGALSTGGAFSTSSTFSATGAFSTSAAFTTTGTGTLTIAAGSSNRTITLGGDVMTTGSLSTTGAFSTSAAFTTTGTGTLTIAAGASNRAITLGGDITTTGALSTSAAFTTTGTGTLTVAAGSANRTITLGGDITTTGALSTTGAFSTSAAFSTTGTGTLTIAAGSTNRTITLGGDITTVGALSTGGALSTSAAFTTTGTGALTIAAGSSATTATLPASGNITLVDLSTAQTLDGKTFTGIVYDEFASQSSVAAPSSTNARFYNKSGSLYFRNATAEYPILSSANAPYFNLGANSQAAGSGYRRVGMYLLYGQTTNATTTRLTSGGAVTPTSSNVIQLPASIGSTWFTKVYVTAWNTNDAAGAAWEISAVFRKTGTAGTLTLLGDPVVIAAADTSQTALQITIQADNSTVTDSIDISVTGLSTKTINWTVNVQTTEVG